MKLSDGAVARLSACEKKPPAFRPAVAGWVLLQRSERVAAVAERIGDDERARVAQGAAGARVLLVEGVVQVEPDRVFQIVARLELVVDADVPNGERAGAELPLEGAAGHDAL